MGGTASQDGNLAQLSKVSKEKPPKKETLPGPETFSKRFSKRFGVMALQRSDTF